MTGKELISYLKQYDLTSLEIYRYYAYSNDSLCATRSHSFISFIPIDSTDESDIVSICIREGTPCEYLVKQIKELNLLNHKVFIPKEAAMEEGTCLVFCDPHGSFNKVLWLSNDWFQDIIFNHEGELTYAEKLFNS